MQLWTECGVAGGIATLDSNAALTPAQIPTQMATWGKYVVTIVGSNLLVNGVVVAALAGATTQSLALFTKAANVKIEQAVIKHSTAFSGGAVSALTASVGISGTLAGIIAALDVFAAVAATGFKEEAAAPTLTLASVGVVLAFSATGANMSALTAGALTVWIKSSVLP